MRKITYPFSAIIGQEQMKKSLILNLINPKIGGVLINGEKGTAKSTIVRSLSNLINSNKDNNTINNNIVEIPLSVSEDRLIGSIDLEKTIKNGQVYLEEGLLKSANKKILYVDEVNLLQDNIVDMLLDVSQSKINTIEREGISYSHESDFTLVGTMNIEEGELRSQFLDRFGLYVDIRSSKDVKKRVDILRRLENFEKNPIKFIDSFLEEEEELKLKIKNAKKILKEVKVSSENLEEIVNYCLKFNIKGHRGDIVMRHTSMAIAALDGRKYIISEDIKEASNLALAHRMIDSEDKSNDKEEQKNKNSNENEDNNSNERDKKNNEDNKNNNEEKNYDKQNDDKQKKQNENNQEESNSNQSKTFNIGKDFKLKYFGHKSDRTYRNGQGKRTRTKTNSKSGRYIYPTMQRKNNDFALDATIRAAAPHQKYRDKNNLAIKINSEDIREKVRQKKVSNLITFVVDSSGSMGVSQRMIETKGAILSLLKDSYIKRDKISLITFRNDKGEVILPPTTSVERGYKLLEIMETGGKTPLNLGISKGYEVIKRELRKNPHLLPLMIIITDGKGNISINKDLKPKQELMEIASSIREQRKINSMVIDIEKSGLMSFGIAKELAKNIGAEYIKIDDLKSESIIKSINNFRGE
ncbi:VWA domain-containing protein [Romboutsia maritimum]|uniref:VWA domain-containing protein n=1 Tax=Romboutsia maritimum TaxID=2020948 RepID=A0A371IX31_9FIRM|nr:AAA family ATPase [Romboutsia maritimum]RDY25028.1 VWA domain-containing protein [Romboutsia maritimum]